MEKTLSADYYKLLFFSIAIALIAYGFTLSNFSLSIDSESIFYPDFALILGRWGTNLFRYHIFGGITPYFTLLLGLLLYCIAVVEMARLFKLIGIAGYVFCGLIVTFPQMSYQLIFVLQADVIGCGFLTGTLSVALFVRSLGEGFTLKGTANFIIAGLMYMFTIALNQSLALIPVIIFTIMLLQNTFGFDYSLKAEIRKLLLFICLCITSFIFYYLSVKILCPPGSGLADSYTDGTRLGVSGFLKLWLTHLAGHSYYGEKTFIVATIIVLILLIRFALKDRKVFIIRFLLLGTLLILPFMMSFFISGGYHPPRLYVASGIVFAFLITYFASIFSFSRLSINLIAFIVIDNIYFITNLYWSNYKIYNHDIEIAKNINRSITEKYPEFDPAKDYVYFYGGLPYEEHERYRLPDSEVFGGSFFIWDGGSNYRITNFMNFADVAQYKVIDNAETFNKIKDSISSMPVWPKSGYIKRVDNVVIVRLGATKGAPLWGIE